MKKIPLSRGLVALVDDEDYDRVVTVGKWYANPSDRTFYARKNFWRDGRCTSIRMHNLITGWPYVDHINGNGLDNRRANLRPATQAQNAKNRRRRSDNTSGFKGVSRHRDRRRWAAAIYIAGRRRHLGLFNDPTDAAKAYDAAASKAFGEFAHLNFPKENA
ncbi:HNH endonuclease [Actinoallomurus purpureus]|uniref:HNH endonuclease n=1 Tax=Actinoallomurus purpureus TaxID=478114 RepID=UPI002092A996|nr:HNH endonuclease [Actinoallomurus purpureus]MCO6011461.1 HNH endonuclease [Actinoallomurus purpureus]